MLTRTYLNVMAGLHYTRQLGLITQISKKMLLAHGASLDQRDRQGHTPMDWAQDRGSWDIVKLLARQIREKILRGLANSSQEQDYFENSVSDRASKSMWQLWDYRP